MNTPRFRTISPIIIVFGGLIVGGLMALLLNYMLFAYLNLGLEGAVGEYTSAIVVAAIVASAIIVLPISTQVRQTLLWLWLLRCLVTLVVMVAYEQHYMVLDAFTYYRSAVSGRSSLGLEWMQGTQNLIVVISNLVNWIPLLKSYPALKVLFSLLGLLGAYLFWLTYVEITGEEDTRILFVLGIFPSLLFWSSILGKDPVVFAGLGMVSLSSVRLLRRPTLAMVFMFAGGVGIVATIRLWMAVTVALSFSLSFIFGSSRFVGRSQMTKGFILIIFCFLAGTLFEKLSFNSQDDVYDRINTVSRGWSSGGSQQEVPTLKTPKQIFLFLPQGMFTALFRPLPGEVNNIFGLLAGLENLVLLFMAFQIFRLLTPGLLRERNFRFLALTVVIWSMLYSMISYQNLGSASRFKIQALPFLLILYYYLKFRFQRSEDSKRVFGMKG